VLRRWSGPPPPLPAHADGGPVITEVVVNKGKNILVGPTAVTKFSAQVTATDPSGVTVADAMLWFGPSYDHRTGGPSSRHLREGYDGAVGNRGEQMPARRGETG
jgi:hypothetical protein